MPRVAWIALFACVLTLAVRPAQAGEALDVLKISVDNVLDVLSSTKPGEPGRVDKLYKAVGSVFDPEELARRTLGANWESFSPEQRARFSKAFLKLLDNTYLRRIEAYTDEKVIFRGEAVRGEGRAEVSTKIVTSTKEVPIVYRLIRRDSWKVYDVVIEGVSLVQNYRNQFNQVLVKESPAQLIGRVESMANAS